MAGAYNRHVRPLLGARHCAGRVPCSISFVLSTPPRRQALVPTDDDQGPERGRGLPKVTQRVRARVGNQLCLQVVGGPVRPPSPDFPRSQPSRLLQGPAREDTVCHVYIVKDHLVLHCIDKEMRLSKDKRPAKDMQMEGSRLS